MTYCSIDVEVTTVRILGIDIRGLRALRVQAGGTATNEYDELDRTCHIINYWFPKCLPRQIVT